MIPIYSIPSTVEQMYSGYRSCFLTDAQFLHFLRYETGVLMPVKATVESINSLFCGSLKRHSSNANRFLTESDGKEVDVESLRIERLKRHPILRPGKRGVIAIDEVLLEKTGEHMEGVGWLYDHCQDKDILCHCVVTSSYNKLGESYPLYLRPYFNQEVCESEEGQELGLEVHTKPDIARGIIEQMLSDDIAGVFAFDNVYLEQQVIDPIEQAGRIWVSSLEKNRTVDWHRRTSEKWPQLQQILSQIPKYRYHKVELYGRVYWCHLEEMHISKLEGKKKILIWFSDQIGQGDPMLLVTNALWFDAVRILSVWLARWPLESLHRECQQHEGLSQYQMRCLEGIRKHWELVACAYAGLVSKRAYARRGVPHRLTLHSVALDVLTEVAIAFAHHVWEKAQQGVESFLSIKWELEAFYSPFKLLSQARCEPLHI